MNLGRVINRGSAYRIGLVLFDVLSIWFSFWFALIARIYIGFSFRAGAGAFLSTLAKILPVYSLLCVVIFGVFKLYRTLWRVAGVSDFQRIDE